MKVSLICFSAISLTLIMNGCKKDHTPPLSQLPPLTSEGKGTFGCLINGNAFKPKRLGINPTLQAAYQQVYNYHTGRSLSIVANHVNSGCDIQSVSIESDSISLEQGKTYVLQSLKPGNFTGRYFGVKSCDNLPNPLYTTDTDTGRLQITFLDTIHQIVSGTFSFNVTNPQGKAIHVTDGRFDMPYVR
jgi:hypothetical protein